MSRFPSIVFIVFLLTHNNVFAQFGFVYNPNVQVFEGNQELTNAWCGGLNYTQISDFDFDMDGDLDLFLFDRSSNNIRVYTQEGTAPNKFYQLVHNSKNFFPSDLRYKALLIDFDSDGRKDLFTNGLSGLKVYRNVSTSGGGLQWSLQSENLYSQYPLTYQPLVIGSDDIPAIVDVDFDGDVDILTFAVSGETMEYHQNQSMEIYGVPDSLVFELRNECWGKFREDATTNGIILNDPNTPCSGGSVTNPIKSSQHAGSTILAYDFDNSGVMDLVLGDVSFSNLTLLLNGGSAPNNDSPMVSIDAAFPSNTNPAEVHVFPAAFLVDVDFDEVKDLLVCPNASTVSENEKSIQWYKNVGSNSLPNFVFMSTDFLQNTQIDHGLGAVPVFTDLNNDGLQDMIVANLFRYKPIIQKESTLAYYQNIGTETNPSFLLIEDDYMNLSTLLTGLRNMPTFGDIDNDGDQDAVIGTDNGSLVYFENVSSGGEAIFGAPQANLVDDQNQTINVGNSCFPQLFDLNNDGLLDLLVTKLTGEINYFQNVGTTQQASFQLINDSLGYVTANSVASNAFVAPHFFRHSDTTHLFVGNVEGEMAYYSDIDENLAPGQSFQLIAENYIDVDANKYSSFWVSDLNNNGLLELYVGQDLGGIYRFEDDGSGTTSIESNWLAPNAGLTISPNPSNDHITIVATQLTQTRVEILAATGQVVLSVLVASKSSHIDLGDLNPGAYYVNVYLEDGTVITKKHMKN